MITKRGLKSLKNPVSLFTGRGRLVFLVALALFVGVVWARLGIEGQNSEENQLPEDAAELPGVTNEWWAVVKETYLQQNRIRYRIPAF